MKCAKVIVFYFGARRAVSPNIEIAELLPRIIENENIDVGVDTDTFFVVNKCGDDSDNLLDEFDGKLTTNGKIRVVKRDNVGLSFGGYIDTFNTYKSEYDYWMFLEDDVIVYKEGYIKDFIDELESTKATFIALAPISTLIKPHCGGGCGLTSTNYMEEIYTSEFVKSKLEEWSKHTGYNVAAGKLREKNAEIEFSSYFNLKNHSTYTPLCANWSNHSSQKRFKYLLRPESEFIYKVGR
jgi:GT2 family glycosyltransferase